MLRFSILGVPVKVEDVTVDPQNFKRHHLYSKSNKSTASSQSEGIAGLSI